MSSTGEIVVEDFRNGGLGTEVVLISGSRSGGCIAEIQAGTAVARGTDTRTVD